MERGLSCIIGSDRDTSGTIFGVASTAKSGNLFGSASTASKIILTNNWVDNVNKLSEMLGHDAVS